MNKKMGFMYGIIALIFSQGIIKILGLAYKLYLTNREGFGDIGNAIYSSGFQIYALLLTISSIGVPNAVAKLVAERKSINDTIGADRIFKISLIAFAMIGFTGMIILMRGANIIANTFLQIPEAELTLVVLSPSIFFVSIISVIRGYFNGLNDMNAMAKSQALEQLFKTIFTVLIVEVIAIISKTDVTIMAAGANFATTLATIVSFLYLYYYYKIKRTEIKKQRNHSKNCRHESAITTLKKILCVTIPMSLSSILSSLNKNIDSFTVVRGLSKIMSSEKAKIQYGILGGKVDTLVSFPLSFNMSFATALVPAITWAISRNDKKDAIKKIRFSIISSLIIALPCTIGMIVFSDQILNLLFPNASEGTLILKLSSISIIFIMLEQTINGALQGIGKLKVPAIALSIGVSIKLLINLLLVPISREKFFFGEVMGAVLGTVVCHIISFLIGFYILNKNIKLNIGYIKILKIIISSILMAVLSSKLYYVLTSIISIKMATIIAIVVAVIVYILAIIILRVFDKEEIISISVGKKIYSKLPKILKYSNKL